MGHCPRHHLSPSVDSAGLLSLGFSQPLSCPSPGPHPAPPCSQVRSLNEVMSPRLASSREQTASQIKALLDLLNTHPVAKGLLALDSITEGKKEKQTMKLKGISFPEPRLTHTNPESVSPWFLPRPILVPASVQCGRSSSHGAKGHAERPRSQGPGRDSVGGRTCEGCLRGQLVRPTVSRPDYNGEREQAPNLGWQLTGG